MTDRYDAVISRKDKNGKTRYTKIGAAFPAKGDNGGFNIVLDALPMPNAEGQAWISLFVPKPRDEQGAAQAPASEMDDSIPF
ncbi:hypothetical protein [Tardiphaga sp. 841_E9_N1_2]|uniref:hypothetical protein n=1 Tax=Tardiphaga sp. 841_E9_N1_2 TaxID=3240762 RepID=UPI003F279F2E